LSKQIVHATLVAAFCIAAVAQAQTSANGGGPSDKKAAPASVVEAPAAAPAVQAPVAPPAAAPAAAPKAVTVVLKGSLFDHNSASLKGAAKVQIDQDVVAKINGFGQVKQVIVAGHTDRIGKAAHNQQLSEKRANAVKDYLVSKGIDGKLIETFGFGATQPVQGVPKCADALPRKKLIECLKPHSRVEVEIQPAAK